jgi:predicted secreted protein
MKNLLVPILLSLLLTTPAYAELNDQGLNSIISIIDKAIDTLSVEKEDGKTPAKDETEVSNSILVNMAKTLGKLSFSRLQCGEATVLGEFTKRVQLAPEQYQNLMRVAFQEGFDKSKADTKLLSDDECKRLTESRQLKAEVVEDKVKAPKKIAEKEKKKETEAEDPSLKHMRLAYMAGQFAYKKKFCGNKGIINKDFNEIMSSMPKEMQKEGKKTYWKGYKQGKRMNKNLTKDDCLSELS